MARRGGETTGGQGQSCITACLHIYLQHTLCLFHVPKRQTMLTSTTHIKTTASNTVTCSFFFFQSNTANGKKKTTKGLWGKSQRSNTNFNMLISHHKKESKETRGKKTPCLQFFLDCKNDSPLFRKTRVIKNNSKTVFLSTGSLLADLCSDCLMAGEGQHMETRLSPYWIMRLSSFPGVIRASLHSIPPHPNQEMCLSVFRISTYKAEELI